MDSLDRHPVPRTCVRLRWPYYQSFSIVWILLLFAGCGNESDRCAVTGTVSVDQSLIARGSISFFPERGHVGPAASTAIVGGHYQFTEINGPTAGPHRVVIGIETDPQGIKGRDNEVPAAAVIKGGPASGGGPASVGGPATLKASETTGDVRQTQWVTAANVAAAESEQANLPIDFDLQSPNVTDVTEDLPMSDPP